SDPRFFALERSTFLSDLSWTTSDRPRSESVSTWNIKDELFHVEHKGGGYGKGHRNCESEGRSGQNHDGHQSRRIFSCGRYADVACRCRSSIQCHLRA